MSSSSSDWVVSIGDVPLPDEPQALCERLGGKAGMLAGLAQAGFDMPPSFVITTAFAHYYLEHDHNWPTDLSKQIRRHVNGLEKRAKRRFGKAPNPLLLSVRGSAPVNVESPIEALLCCGLNPDLAESTADETAFWNLYLRYIRDFAYKVHGLGPDVFESVGIDVVDDPARGRQRAEAYFKVYKKHTRRKFPTRCWDQLKQVIGAMLDVWQRTADVSDSTESAGSGRLAIMVQQMGPLQSRASAMTEDPDDPFSDHVRIDVAPGPLSGSATVSPGEQVHINRRDAVEDLQPAAAAMPVLDNLLSSPSASGPLLSVQQQRHLAHHALRIESYLSSPVAVTFAAGGSHVTLLRVRTIASDRIVQDIEPARREQIHKLVELAEQGRGPWLRCALDERLQHPTTLTWDLVQRLVDAKAALGQLVRTAGYCPSRCLEERGFVECVAGRIYADAASLPCLFGVRATPRPEAILCDPDNGLLDFPPRMSQSEVRGRAGPARRWVLARAARRCRRLAHRAEETWREEVLPGYLDWIAEEQSRSLHELADGELLDVLERCCSTLLDEHAAALFLPGWLAVPVFDRFATLLMQLMGAEHGREYALALTQSLDGDATCRLGRDLATAIGDDEGLEDLLDQYGHRVAGELELAIPRWREAPAALERIARRLGTGGARRAVERFADARLRRNQAGEDMASHLRRWGGTVFQQDLTRDVATAQQLLACRESAWHFFMMGYEQIRRIVEELSQRWNLGERIYDLHYDELFQLPSQRAALIARARQRYARRLTLHRISVPDRIDAEHLEELGDEQAESAEATGSPRPLGPGLADGRVRVVSDPACGELGPGDVLVCRAADAGWMPLLLLTAAVVVEQGGLLSSAAVASRAMGLPVIGWPGACRRLRPGWVIRIDGHTGRLTVLEG